jgi:membrane-bound serine protease (ClpP class)
VKPRVTALTRARSAAVFIALALAAGLMGARGALAQSAPQVHVIDVTGVINPLTVRYLDRALAGAEAAGIELLVMRLDTPGGLDTAMREMTQAMLAARVPVVVYVAPSGARAASAGMFLTLAAHVSAMAPGTNIGAAHPVSLGEQLDAVASEKAAQDAAATARTLALQRGRSAEWAEKAVLESVSLTSAEALERGLIDMIAADMNDLLAQLDGRVVTTTAGNLTLRTRGALVVNMPMNFAERLLHVITDPNVAYLLLTLGLYSLLIEFQAPGFGLPGTVGVMALVLAFVAFGSLPLNWAGLGLIALGVILLIVEALSPGFGAAGAAGLIMFALGSLMLYQPIGPTSPVLPAVTVNPWLVALITGGTGALILVAVRKALQAQRAPAASDVPRRLVGTLGQVKTDLNPIGTAQIGSELWTAVANDEGAEPIRAGEVVAVVAVDGLTLRVRRAETPPHSSSGGSHV